MALCYTYSMPRQERTNMTTKTAKQTPTPIYHLRGEKGRESRWIEIRHDSGEDMNLVQLNLYSAAPELLEAAKAADALFQGIDDRGALKPEGHAEWAKVRAALVKAGAF